MRVVGRLAPEKNLNLVTRAFTAIRTTRPEARMVWVGDPAGLAAMGGAARQAILPRSWERVVEKFEAVAREALSP